MTRPINLYAMTRIREEVPFNIIERHQSQRADRPRIQHHEIESLRRLTDSLTGLGVSVEELDGFYFGYHIPQIGKEFDLLKFSGRSCLNIELKSQAVPESQILSQLLKNRHYLSHLGMRLNLYTVVTDSMTCYKLSVGGDLAVVSPDEIAAAVQRFREDWTLSIDELFRASEYLVSPITTPKKFIQGEYFLTQAQDQIKLDLLKEIEEAGERAFFHLTGKPGTGKTLLLYDIARTLSGFGRTVIVHCGPIREEQRLISRDIANLQITDADSFCDEAFQPGLYSFVLVDESHRLYEKEFYRIVDSVAVHEQICVFSSDPEQVLTTAEKERDIAGKIAALPLRHEFVLSEKIRYNKEMFSFIACLKNLNHKPEEKQNYLNVDIHYAADAEEAVQLLKYYREKGYVFINYARENPEQGNYTELEEHFDIYHVIGMEFDKVVMLMDPSFYYDEEGILRGVPHPDPDLLYPNLFYQGVTRVREKLSLVVVNAPELFDKICSIVK